MVVACLTYDDLCLPTAGRCDRHRRGDCPAVRQSVRECRPDQRADHRTRGDGLAGAAPHAGRTHRVQKGELRTMHVADIDGSYLNIISRYYLLHYLLVKANVFLQLSVVKCVQLIMAVFYCFWVNYVDVT